MSIVYRERRSVSSHILLRRERIQAKTIDSLQIENGGIPAVSVHRRGLAPRNRVRNQARFQDARYSRPPLAAVGGEGRAGCSRVWLSTSDRIIDELRNMDIKGSAADKNRKRNRADLGLELGLHGLEEAFEARQRSDIP